MAAMIPCVYCKKAISGSASRCPYCQGEYTPEQVAARSKTAKKNLGIGCASILGLVLLVGMCSSGDESAIVPDKPTESAKTDALMLYKQVLKVAEPCDRAAKGVAIMVKTGDPVGTYRSAQNAATACLATTSEMRKIEVPASVGAEHFKTLKSAVENCENAYVSKWSAMSSAQKAIDGGGKVSDLAAFEASAEASQQGAILCVAGLAAVTTQLGVKPEELSGNDDKGAK